MGVLIPEPRQAPPLIHNFCFEAKIIQCFRLPLLQLQFLVETDVTRKHIHRRLYTVVTLAFRRRIQILTYLLTYLLIANLYPNSNPNAEFDF